jgi:hypothetical protein
VSDQLSKISMTARAICITLIALYLPELFPDPGIKLIEVSGFFPSKKWAIVVSDRKGDLTPQREDANALPTDYRLGKQV